MATDGLQTMSRAWAEVSAEAVAFNIAALKARFGRGGRTRILAVVKADAYGHGLSVIAPLCFQCGLCDFGVATADEGIRLRALLPPQARLYVLAPTLPADAEAVVSHGLIPLVSDPALGRALSEEAQKQGTTIDVHLDVDTGIGRAGVCVGDAISLLQTLDSLPSLRVMGLATHFASADEDALDAQNQNLVFAQLVQTLGARAHFLLLHASNSPAAVALSPDASYDLIRPGLLLYGIEPAPGMLAAADLFLRPVLSLRARVLLCRRLPGGATVSYGRTYTVPPGGGIYATLGIGYGDGWPRRAGQGIGSVLLRGERAPLCGRVCMDQLVVDVSHIPSVQAGNIATLIGQDGADAISAGDIAAQIAATPHEITTCLTGRLPRLLVD